MREDMIKATLQDQGEVSRRAEHLGFRMSFTTLINTHRGQ